MSYLNYYGCTTEGLTIKVIAFSSAKHRDHWVGRALLERESLTGAEVRRLFNSEKHYTSVNCYKGSPKYLTNLVRKKATQQRIEEHAEELPKGASLVAVRLTTN